MPQIHLISHPSVKVDGSSLTPEILLSLTDLSVDNAIFAPNMLTLRFLDEGFKLLDSDTFDLGKEVEVQMATEVTDFSTTENGTLFKGEIVSVEGDLMSSHTQYTVVRAFNKLHRLGSVRKQRSFKDVTISDVITQVANEAGLTTAGLASTNQVFSQIDQKGMTNLEFLRFLAYRGALVFWVDGEGKLRTRAVDGAASGAEIELSWGEDLQTLRPRATLAQKVSKVKVKGWSPSNKQVVEAEHASAVAEASTGFSSSVSMVTSKLGAREIQLTDELVINTSSATTIAKSVMAHVNGGFVEADGLSTGNPNLQLMEKVRFNNIGQKFNGSYTITAVVHSYTTVDGYVTQFTVGGLRARLPEVGGWEQPGLERAAGKIYGRGLEIGLVTDVKNDGTDSSGLGQSAMVKVKFPTMTEEHSSQWCRLASPMAGANRGFLFVPEVNDEVAVAFIDGDLTQGVVLGAMWSGTDSPPRPHGEYLESGSQVRLRTIKTRCGHIFEFDDKNGSEKITLTSKSGHTLILDDTSPGKITLQDKSSNFLEFDCGANSIKFECAGDFIVKSQKKVLVEGQMGIEFTTPMTIKHEASLNFEVTAQAAIKLTATGQFEATASGTMTLSAQGVAELSSSGILTIRGSLVKIN